MGTWIGFPRLHRSLVLEASNWSGLEDRGGRKEVKMSTNTCSRCGGKTEDKARFCSHGPLPTAPHLRPCDGNSATFFPVRISYDNLFRNNETYRDKLVYYQGEVIQVSGGSGDRYVLRVNVTKAEYFWEDSVYLHYTGSRLLEDDVIEFVEESEALRHTKPSWVTQ